LEDKRLVSRAAKLMQAIFHSISAGIPGFASLNIFSQSARPIVRELFPSADVANLRRESGW
jgi:hypothetical protein